jgi:hypothetical protein
MVGWLDDYITSLQLRNKIGLIYLFRNKIASHIGTVQGMPLSRGPKLPERNWNIGWSKPGKIVINVSSAKNSFSAELICFSWIPDMIYSTLFASSRGETDKKRSFAIRPHEVSTAIEPRPTALYTIHNHAVLQVVHCSVIPPPSQVNIHSKTRVQLL